MSASSSWSVSLPPAWFFEFPPSSDPLAVPPPETPVDFRPLSHPTGIDPTLYRTVLQPAWPITIAIGYVTLVKITNQYNRRRGFKPWALSKSSLFHAFVVLHNVLLAVYSGLTCVAMVRAMHKSLVSPFGPHGTAGLIDSLCKMHGPRGFGSAVTYSPSTSLWSSKSHLVHLAANGFEPESTDVGRIWNEGLAYWGWFFYLSKFYEVIDTFIILAKGKRSSTLQTYHHAGAMMCMWAGIRYMSAPIWMFVLVNSGIHTVMYSYYTLSAVGIRVPNHIKRVITTCQIMQFIVGVVFATVHLFVSYSTPTSVAYKVASAAVAAASSASSVASAAASTATNRASLSSLAAAAATSVDGLSWLKRMALRAANMEGPAENVRVEGQHEARADAFPLRSVEEVKYRIEYQTVQCLDTSGQAFAIYLNVFYLLPLMALFMRFFVQTYIMSKPPAAGAKPRPRRISESASEAARRTSNAVEDMGKALEATIGALGQEAAKGNEAAAQELAAKKKQVKELVEEAKGKRDAGEALDDDEAAVEGDAPRATHGHDGQPASYAEAIRENLPGDEANGVINKADVSEL